MASPVLDLSGSTDVAAFLSAAAMAAHKAETYSPDTYVIDLAELRQIIFELQHESEQEAS
jgi:hypothetical protein